MQICIDNGEFRGVNCILRMQCINRFNKYKQHEMFFLLCIKKQWLFPSRYPKWTSCVQTLLLSMLCMLNFQLSLTCPNSLPSDLLQRLDSWHLTTRWQSSKRTLKNRRVGSWASISIINSRKRSQKLILECGTSPVRKFSAKIKNKIFSSKYRI